jgi:hypothetical protein
MLQNIAPFIGWFVLAVIVLIVLCICLSVPGKIVINYYFKLKRREFYYDNKCKSLPGEVETEATAGVCRQGKAGDGKEIGS